MFDLQKVIEELVTIKLDIDLLIGRMSYLFDSSSSSGMPIDDESRQAFLLNSIKGKIPLLAKFNHTINKKRSYSSLCISIKNTIMAYRHFKNNK